MEELKQVPIVSLFMKNLRNINFNCQI